MRKRLRLTSLVILVGTACSGVPAEEPLAISSGGAHGASTGGKGAGGAPPGSGSGGAAAASNTGGGTAGGSSVGTGGAGGDVPGGSGGSAPGAGGADALADAPGEAPSPPAAGCNGAKFCDDFEGQERGKPPTGMFTLKVSSSATLLVDDTKFANGKKSLAIKGPRGSFGAQLVFGAPQLPLPANDLHGRMMVWITKVPGGGVHWDGVLASGPLASGRNSTYVLGGMYGNFMAVYHPGDCSVDSNTKFPEGRWACIQWQFKGAKDGTHLLKMMLDGQVVDKGAITTKGPNNCAAGNNGGEWLAPAFQKLTVGWINYQASPIPVEMWIDDLAFGESEIPCPAK